jgi:hypothetical protein
VKFLPSVAKIPPTVLLNEAGAELNIVRIK